MSIYEQLQQADEGRMEWQRCCEDTRKILALCAQWLPKDLPLREVAFRVALNNADPSLELKRLS